MSFVTIWIFARIRQNACIAQCAYCFVTIWIFARIRPTACIKIMELGFVTIWIFARMTNIDLRRFVKMSFTKKTTKNIRIIKGIKGYNDD